MTPLHQPAQDDLYTGRKSEEREYWYQYIKCQKDLNIASKSGKKKIALLGYAGEEGIRRNQGRVGASEGPTSIRRMIGPMSYHLSLEVDLFDFGTIKTYQTEMEASHNAIQKFTLELLKNNYFPVLIGGGHDLALPHGSAAIEFALSQDKKLGIINLDAHFDLRVTNNNEGHSGSPFYQLSEKYNADFNYLCLGIQPAANPVSLFRKAEDINTAWVVATDLNLDNWEFINKTIQAFIDNVDLLYLTVDMDGYHSGIAPGVSAPSPTGFTSEIAFKIFKKIAESKKLQSFDVVEVNPTYDIDNATSRLAARTIEYILTCTFPNSNQNIEYP